MEYNPIIIPSKHIYGQPKYSTTNNIINNIDYEENKLSNEVSTYGEQKKVTLYTYSTDSGKEAYFGDVRYSGVTTYTEVYQDETINDFASTTEIIETDTTFEYKTTVNFDLSNLIIPENFLENLQISSDTVCRGKKSIYDNNYKLIGETEYGTDTYTQIQPVESNMNHLKITNARIDNNILYIDVYVFKSAKTPIIGSTILPLNYTLSLYGVNYRENFSKKTIGSSKADLSIETNELIQSETKTTKFNYNKINIVNALYPNERRFYATTNLPVTSELTILAKSSKLDSAPVITLTIPVGESKSNTIVIGLLDGVFSIFISVTPSKDNIYTYYYDGNELEYLPIGKSIANNIINNYTNGKKRMNLEAGYGDYYYADGTPYGGVAGKKMLLQVGDIVQPMRWDGSKDVPYSLDIYGNSRVFEITSAELNVGGAPKLYLELLQKTT